MQTPSPGTHGIEEKSMTEHEARAKALLPCTFISCDYEVEHLKGCPAHYRPAVAAAFAEAYNAEQTWFDAAKLWEAEVDKLKAEVAAQAKEIERLKQQIVILENPRVTEDDWQKLAGIQNEQLKQLRTELAAARIEGLREAQANVCVDCAARVERQIAALEQRTEYVDDEYGSRAKMKAAELLPCENVCDEGQGHEHSIICPAYYRPAIATALAQAEKRGEKNCNHWFTEANAEHNRNEKLQAEIAALLEDKSSLTEALDVAMEDRTYYEGRIAQLENPTSCGHYGANLQPDDSNIDVCVVCVELAAARVEGREEIYNLLERFALIKYEMGNHNYCFCKGAPRFEDAVHGTRCTAIRAEIAAIKEKDRDNRFLQLALDDRGARLLRLAGDHARCNSVNLKTGKIILTAKQTSRGQLRNRK